MSKISKRKDLVFLKFEIIYNGVLLAVNLVH